MGFRISFYILPKRKYNLLKNITEQEFNAKVLSKKACQIGAFIGIDTGFKMMEQVLDMGMSQTQCQKS